MPSTAVDSPRPVAQADDQRNRVAIYGTPVPHSVAPGLFDITFPAIGLPKHKKLQGMEKVDELTPQAQAIGSVNTRYVRVNEATGKAVDVGTNLDTAGVGKSLHLDLRPLESAEQVQQERSALEAKACDVEEKNVYAVAKAAFEWPYKPEGTQGEAGFLSLPQKPTFFEMAYKPGMTIMRGIAEKSGWKTICGVEAVLKGCFEQCKLWTGIEVPLEVREAGRKVLRAE
ncbi:hypothetical protein JCM10213v2_009136 [Rhodosporidiobolus nylandii]